jgi:mannose-6-phosphate isomerase
LGLPYPPGTKVGESWELSAGVELPSRTAEGELLADVLARDPAAMLGDEAALGRTTSALLVKWLDAGDDLSLQLHPTDDARGLSPGEAGKVEAWYVVAHAPGACIHLGFRTGVAERDVRLALERGDDLSKLMAQRPVEVGDLIVLEPGTPHAVGRGIALIEPQHVDPSKRALTYRYWDWNRRYDAHGRPSREGAPRALHVEQALLHTRWDRASDAAWLASCCGRFGTPDLTARATTTELCGPSNTLRSAQLRIARMSGTGAAALPAWNALRAVTVVQGSLQIGEVEAAQGTTIAVPAACGPLPCELAGAHAIVSAVAS